MLPVATTALVTWPTCHRPTIFSDPVIVRSSSGSPSRLSGAVIGTSGGTFAITSARSATDTAWTVTVASTSKRSNSMTPRPTSSRRWTRTPSAACRSCASRLNRRWSARGVPARRASARCRSSSDGDHRSPLSSDGPRPHASATPTEPPATLNTWPLTSHSGLPSQTTSGATLAGELRSNSSASARAPARSHQPFGHAGARTRRDGVDRTP